jgi:hypothetical protein
LRCLQERWQSGETTIGPAELEMLVDFLKIPAYEIWGVAQDIGNPHQVVVQAQPSETVQVVGVGADYCVIG